MSATTEDLIKFLRGLFAADLSAQTRKLADSLTWVVSHLRQTDEVVRQLHELGRRHIGYGAQPAHYPIVAAALVAAIAAEGAGAPVRMPRTHLASGRRAAHRASAVLASPNPDQWVFAQRLPSPLR